MRIVIIGGGIAGLGLAYHLARAGGRAIHLIEQETSVASHSSGRNAAIFVSLDDASGAMSLAGRTRAHLDTLFGPGPETWLRPTGFVYVAPSEAALVDLTALARRTGTPHEQVAHPDLVKRFPVLEGGAARCGLVLPDAGVVDIHAVTSRLAAAARAAGASLQLEARVDAIGAAHGRVNRVVLASGEAIAADAVVIAGGAWAAMLGASCGAPLPLVPLRRHLVHLEASEPVPVEMPTIWGLGDEVYFRPETGGVLASPCDEEPWPPGLPPHDPAALELLAGKLSALAPRLGPAGVRRVWACLRTFAPDRLPVAGADRRVEGLFWLAGLGGSGMTVGVGAAEMVAALVRGDEHPLAGALSPMRTFGAPRRH